MTKLLLKITIILTLALALALTLSFAVSANHINIIKKESSYQHLKKILSSLKKPVSLTKTDGSIEKAKDWFTIIELAQNYYLSNKMEMEFGALKEYQIHLSWALEHESEIDKFYNTNSKKPAPPAPPAPKEVFISKLTDAIVSNKTELKELLKPYFSSIKVDLAKI
ncbi:MAG: hypothetical protein HQK49_04375 [Oligoflexia bacterium]|nr:hypothetical protein [Oligoflexia bacterium]